MKTERFEALMVKVVDGVATAAERLELDTWVADHPELRKELEDQMTLKAVTDGWIERLELDLAQDRVHAEPLTRVERGVGGVLLGLGVAVLAGFGLTELLMDPGVPTWAKVGTGLVSAGTLVLLISVVRFRLRTRSHDKYTEVVR